MAYVYQEYPKVLYHPKLAPEGKTFNAAEDARGYTERKGWVNTPAKFPKPPRFSPALKAWWTEWEWAFKGVAVVAALIAAFVAMVKAILH
jgi:hypothetical protein